MPSASDSRRRQRTGMDRSLCAVAQDTRAAMGQFWTWMYDRFADTLWWNESVSLARYPTECVDHRDVVAREVADEESL